MIVSRDEVLDAGHPIQYRFTRENGPPTTKTSKTKRRRIASKATSSHSHPKQAAQKSRVQKKRAPTKQQSALGSTKTCGPLADPNLLESHAPKFGQFGEEQAAAEIHCGHSESLSASQYAAATALAAAAQLLAYKEEVRKLRDYISLLQVERQQLCEKNILTEKGDEKGNYFPQGEILCAPENRVVNVSKQDERPVLAKNNDNFADLHLSASHPSRTAEPTGNFKRMYLDQVEAVRRLTTDMEQERRKLNCLQEEAQHVGSLNDNLRHANECYLSRISELEARIGDLERDQEQRVWREASLLEHNANLKFELQLAKACPSGMIKLVSPDVSHIGVLHGSVELSDARPQNAIAEAIKFTDLVNYSQIQSTCEEQCYIATKSEVSMDNSNYAMELETMSTAANSAVLHESHKTQPSSSTVAHAAGHSRSSSISCTVASANIGIAHDKVARLVELVGVCKQRMSEYRVEVRDVILSHSRHTLGDIDCNSIGEGTNRFLAVKCRSPSPLPINPTNRRVGAPEKVNSHTSMANLNEAHRELSTSVLHRAKHLNLLNNQVKELTRALQRAAITSTMLSEGEILYAITRHDHCKNSH